MATARHIDLFFNRAGQLLKSAVRTVDDDYKRDESGRFSEGDRVHPHGAYDHGHGPGTVKESRGDFHVVKHDDGHQASYHGSNLKHHEDDDEEDTHDAGDFDEHKHKRDAGGKFSTSGAAGGNEAHHDAQAKHHSEIGFKKGIDHPDRELHDLAYQHHAAAAKSLSYAGFEPNNEHGLRDTHLQRAQSHAEKAAEAEARLRPEDRKSAAAGPAMSMGNARARVAAAHAAANPPVTTSPEALARRNTPAYKALAAKVSASRAAAASLSPAEQQSVKFDKGPDWKPKAAAPENAARQLASRKSQIAQQREMLNDPSYSPEDKELIRGRIASLQRMVANYGKKAGGTGSMIKSMTGAGLKSDKPPQGTMAPKLSYEQFVSGRMPADQNKMSPDEIRQRIATLPKTGIGVNNQRRNLKALLAEKTKK